MCILGTHMDSHITMNAVRITYERVRWNRSDAGSSTGIRWNNDDARSSIICAGTVTYTYAGSSTTLDQSHYYTGYTLEQRRRWIIDNMRWNSHIYIRWIIDNTGSSTTLDHRQRWIIDKMRWIIDMSMIQGDLSMISISSIVITISPLNVTPGRTPAA